MHDQPSAIELLRAVQDFIRNHAMPQLDGHVAFHARVAANVLGIVERELALGPNFDEQERQRLIEMLGSSGDLDALNRELCARIRSGEFTSHTPGLLPHLWETTLAKVAIDQPNYEAYRRAMSEHSAGQKP